MIPVRTILLAFVLAASPFLDLARQSPAESSPTLESARKRWDRFTPEQKERARSRYERFLAMSEEEREQLTESARRLRQRTERIQAEVMRKAGDDPARLDPEQRRELVSEIVAEESRAIGARMRGRLPENLVRRLENARPVDRARFFRQFRIQQRDRVARYAIGELGKRLALPAEEIRRLQALPGDERGEAVLDLRKRLSAQEVDASGLPPGITREQWDGWLELPPEDFFEEFQRYRESRIAAHAKEEKALRELFEAARPRPEEALALAGLAREERRTKLERKRRERCTRALVEGELLAREELEALETRSDPEFFAVVRRLLSKSAGPLWRERPGGDAAPR